MNTFTPANIKMWSRLGSCGAYGFAMNLLAEQDKNIAAITSDLCYYSGLDRFKRMHPDCFYNVGIAEQNMLGVAAGMASEGMTVFASTYATFAAARILDQVRVNMGYMQLPVKLVGLTAGLSVGILGATHMGSEDIAAIRCIPNITVVSPADTTETVKAVLAAAQTEGPFYIRLSGIMGSPVVYKEDYDFTVGKAIELRSGKDICMIATGTMVAASLRAADILGNHGFSASVIDMHTIKPLDTDKLKEKLGCRLLVTVEEHSRIGGLGAAVAEAFSEYINKPPHLIIGLPDCYPHADTYDNLIELCGLSADSIAEKILSMLKVLS